MKFITGLIFGVLIVIFIFQNIDMVVVNFLFWNISISRSLLIFVIFLIGIILGVLINGIKKPKQKPEHKEFTQSSPE